MIFFLDANVVIDAIRSKTALIMREHFKKIDSSNIKISSIVVAELEYGAKHSNDYEKNKALYRQFIKDFEIIPFTHNEAVVYGDIRQKLAEKGQLIGANDMLIAATVLSYNATIITHNVDEFSRIPNLLIEDWTKA